MTDPTAAAYRRPYFDPHDTLYWRCLGGAALAGAKNIGRADISRSGLSDVAGPRQPAEDQSEWDRTHRIGDC